MMRFSPWVALFLLCACGPDEAEVERLVEKGRRLFLRGDYHAVIDTLNRAASLDESEVVGRLYLSRAYLRLSRYDEALEHIEAAIAHDPQRPSLYEVLGNIHLSRYTAFAYSKTQQADGRSAIAAFRKAISLDSTRAAPHYNLGIVDGYLDSTRLEELSFIAALDADSSLAAAHKKLGTIKRESGRLQEALRSLAQATRLAPDDAQAHYQLGLAHRDAGNFARAAVSLERAAAPIRFHPKSASVSATCTADSVALRRAVASSPKRSGDAFV